MRAHAGHQRMDDVENLEDGGHPLLAVRLHGADFGQCRTGVDAQRSVPDDAGHVLQAGGEASQRLARQAVTDDARPPLRQHLGDGGRIETIDRQSGVHAVGLTRLMILSVEDIDRQFSGIGVAALASSTTRELIFFRPMPGVADRSTNGVLRMFPSVRPSSANGRRRSADSPNRPAACRDGPRTPRRGAFAADSRSG